MSDNATTRQLRVALRERFSNNRSNEWVFIEELRNSSGYTNGANGYIDGFALNCFPSKGFERIAFEVKASRSDFLKELKQPMKRKIALLYSNQFYFVAPAGLIKPAELPPEAGLLELQPPDAPQQLPEGHFWSKPLRNAYWLKEAVGAPWRDTPPPSWGMLASVSRKLRSATREDTACSCTGFMSAETAEREAIQEES